MRDFTQLCVELSIAKMNYNRTRRLAINLQEDITHRVRGIINKLLPLPDADHLTSEDVALNTVAQQAYQVRVAQVRQQVRRDGRLGLHRVRERLHPGLEHRVLGVPLVELDGPVVGVHGRLRGEPRARAELVADPDVDAEHRG